eukprot:scaffold1314_cov158-Amphora_coffeaeformis.AAC.9
MSWPGPPKLFYSHSFVLVANRRHDDGRRRKEEKPKSEEHVALESRVTPSPKRQESTCKPRPPLRKPCHHGGTKYGCLRVYLFGVAPVLP